MLPFILPTSNPLPFSQYHHDHHTFFVANWRITNCGSRSKIKNPLTLVCLPRQMLSKMVCHDTVALMATGKGLYACPCRWGLGPGTTHPMATWHQPNNPWKFCLNWSICSKVIQDFPKHRHTNKSPLYSVRVQVNFLPCFSTFSLTTFASFAPSLHFIHDN